MKYKKIKKAKFIDRPNRFIARVDIDGKEERVHVKNTGRCKELLVPNAKLILEDASHNKNRKTKYSLIKVYKDELLINMDSQVPNKVVFDALMNNDIQEIQDLDLIKREQSYKNSRFDIYYEKSDEKAFIEVKGVTLESNGIAMFPDAPTSRGTKHILDMVDAVENGYKGYIFFLIQMRGPKEFRINREVDPDFFQAIKFAKNKGVKILAYDSILSENSISIGQAIKINLK